MRWSLPYWYFKVQKLPAVWPLTCRYRVQPLLSEGDEAPHSPLGQRDCLNFDLGENMAPPAAPTRCRHPLPLPSETLYRRLQPILIQHKR